MSESPSTGQEMSPEHIGEKKSSVDHFGTYSTKDQFLECVDKTLSKAQGTSVLQHFRPLFNVSIVTEAYNDLCSNETVTQGDEDLSCLVNATALLPCYTEYYNYLFYLSVVKRFGSQERQLPDDVVNTLLCTLAEERRDCEVAALSKCSTKVGEVMQSFYQKTLPAVCQEDESDVRSRSEVSTPSDTTPTSG
ncbi:hypothetical protein C0Q70_05615 [Pomacea canaliculata]|uniref:Uncharacterized protein n=1 Tax=Pomacea canaliculata TaxID=400727 RepID=A0A2T7PLR8_POMCA|nr:hypothetical protein C0Q70_05615 [Pomacea canaliculata]